MARVKKDAIAIVGAGKGGTAILETLLKMPEVVVRHLCDVDPGAPGMRLARTHGIPRHTDLAVLCRDASLDLIFEATGRPEVTQRILALKPPHTRVIGSEDAKIIFHLLDLQQGVTQRLESRVRERTRDLAATNAKLQQINDEKTRYLMHATHQLKAPFAAIQSYADIILGGYTGEVPARTREIVKKIHERCVLLGDAIKQMLELANLKSLVQENVRMERTPLEPLVASAVKHLADIAAARRIRIAAAGALGSQVRCNRNQVLILLSVLIENAVHYSPDGSEIRVLVEAPASSGRVRVSVKDSGIGIRKEHLGRIFDEYFRSNEAAAMHEQGTGLGLAIAQKIAAIHGTRVEVESAPGRGSTFFFRLEREASGRRPGTRRRRSPSARRSSSDRSR